MKTCHLNLHWWPLRWCCCLNCGLLLLLRTTRASDHRALALDKIRVWLLTSTECGIIFTPLKNWKMASQAKTIYVARPWVMHQQPLRKATYLRRWLDSFKPISWNKGTVFTDRGSLFHTVASCSFVRWPGKLSVFLNAQQESTTLPQELCFICIQSRWTYFPSL